MLTLLEPWETRESNEASSSTAPCSAAPHSTGAKLYLLTLYLLEEFFHLLVLVLQQ